MLLPVRFQETGARSFPRAVSRSKTSIANSASLPALPSPVLASNSGISSPMLKPSVPWPPPPSNRRSKPPDCPPRTLTNAWKQHRIPRSKHRPRPQNYRLQSRLADQPLPLHLRRRVPINRPFRKRRLLRNPQLVSMPVVRAARRNEYEFPGSRSPRERQHMGCRVHILGLKGRRRSPRRRQSRRVNDRVKPPTIRRQWPRQIMRPKDIDRTRARRAPHKSAHARYEHTTRHVPSQ